MHDNMPILILFDAAPEFTLTVAELESAVGYQANVKQPSGGGLRKLEVVADGLSFYISFHNAEKTKALLGNCDFSNIFTGQPKSGVSAISISYGHHILSGKHTKTINRAILRLGRILGSHVAASTIVWLPADVHCDFTFFTLTALQYEDGGPFPVLAQIAITESANGIFTTTGLAYFAQQEIKLITSESYDSAKAMKRLVRIAHDVATNGKIDNYMICEGLASDEIISFSPLEGQNIVEITISEEGEKPPR